MPFTKKEKGQVASAIPAIPAIDRPESRRTIATIATIAIASKVILKSGGESWD